MTWKKAMAIVCVLVCLLGLSACTTSNTSDKESLQQQTQTETAVSGEGQIEESDNIKDRETHFEFLCLLYLIKNKWIGISIWQFILDTVCWRSAPNPRPNSFCFLSDIFRVAFKTLQTVD